MSTLFIEDHFYTKRLALSGAGQKTPVAASFALSAGFGTTASVSAIQAGACDGKFNITITSAGTGQAANPTCTLTFVDGAFKAAAGATALPVAVVCRSAGSQILVPVTATCTATTCVITFNGTPVAAETYGISAVVVG